MIGEKITQLRKMKGLTLTELAERSDISKSNLSNIEREINKNPSIKVLEKITKVLDTNLISLLELKTGYESLFPNLLNLNLSEEELEEYKDIIEYIEWKNKQGQSS